MSTLIKTTTDGRKLEVVGLAIHLDGKLEAFELIEVLVHPKRAAVWQLMPEATHLAGRVALNAEEAARVLDALREGESRVIQSPAAIYERFRIAAMWKAREQGIE